MQPLAIYKNKNRSLQKLNRRLRGDALIEAMIGMALMGLIGVGISHMTSKISVVQRDMNVQDIAISKMRYYVIQNGADHDLCVAGAANAPDLALPVENESALETTVQGCADVEVTIGGTTLADGKTPIVMSVTSPSIGEMRVGGSGGG